MKLKRGLLVSCQAVKGEPLYGYGIMHLFAKAAEAGGASGIRALAEEVDSIKATVDIPVIGLTKQCYSDSEIYITPTKKDVDKLLQTKCDVICMDATNRARPNGETLEEVYLYARKHCNGRELMADVSTFEEAQNAEKLGFEYISTTLRGYTDYTKNCVLPDLDFVAQCKNGISNSKIIAEGGYFEASQVEKLSDINPYALVIGSAITRPKMITEYFNNALKLKDED